MNPWLYNTIIIVQMRTGEGRNKDRRAGSPFLPSLPACASIVRLKRVWSARLLQAAAVPNS